VEPLEVIEKITEENDKPTKVSKTLLRYIGIPVSLELVYYYDLSRSNYHKIQMRSDISSSVLSKLDLYKMGFTKNKQVIHLDSMFKYFFRDGNNSARKYIAIQMANDEDPNRNQLNSVTVY
jgi:hypothetical protein